MNVPFSANLDVGDLAEAGEVMGEGGEEGGVFVVSWEAGGGRKKGRDVSCWE